MNELELIVQGLERRGSEVVEFWYHEQGESFATDGSLIIGANEGIELKDCYFIGNVNLYGTISGTVTLTGANLVMLDFSSYMKGRDETGICLLALGIGNGFNLLGNGTYVCNKRLYGMGFNRIVYSFTGFAAATKVMYVRVNGYIFRMK